MGQVEGRIDGRIENQFANQSAPREAAPPFVMIEFAFRGVLS